MDMEGLEGAAQTGQDRTGQYNKTWRSSSAHLHVQVATNPAITES